MTPLSSLTNRDEESNFMCKKQQVQEGKEHSETDVQLRLNQYISSSQSAVAYFYDSINESPIIRNVEAAMTENSKQSKGEQIKIPLNRNHVLSNKQSNDDRPFSPT